MEALTINGPGHARLQGKILVGAATIYQVKLGAAAMQDPSLNNHGYAQVLGKFVGHKSASVVKTVVAGRSGGCWRSADLEVEPRRSIGRIDPSIRF